MDSTLFSLANPSKYLGNGLILNNYIISFECTAHFADQKTPAVLSVNSNVFVQFEVKWGGKEAHLSTNQADYVQYQRE